MTVARPYDVLIVGAGPAGATAGALLARGGQRVLILEKQHFPRFHVGESLLPAGLAILERLGIAPRADTFLYKRGAEFVCEASGRSQKFHFDQALPGTPPHAWHVDRADFDTLLRDRAAERGAEIRHGVTVTGVDIGARQVQVRSTTGAAESTTAARYFIDASGQDRFLGRQQRSIRTLDCFGASAVFSRFDGLGPEALAEMGPDNDIRVLLRDDGWGWMIPLPGARLSLGAVSTRPVTRDFLDRGLLAGPLARRWTAGAQRVQTGVIQDFSYRNTRTSGARYAVVGDAACFLDPIFSSGVALAMRGAEDLADLLLPALESGAEAAPDLAAPQHARMERAYQTFTALIDRFYNTRFAEAMFLTDPAGLPLRQGVMSVLAGDVWRHDNPFQELLLQARRRTAM